MTPLVAEVTGAIKNIPGFLGWFEGWQEREKK
jgi:hypothetical protein